MDTSRLAQINSAVAQCSLAELAPRLHATAMALDRFLVDDAARRSFWSRLPSDAQQILGALCAAGQAPHAPPASAPSGPAVAAAQLERFPGDVLGAIIAFVDLPMRFSCVAASRTMRDACMRLSPRLERSLVSLRFPLLTTVTDIRTAPRELFRTFTDFEASGGTFMDVARGGATMPQTTASGLEAFTLSLELVVGKWSQGETRTVFRTHESVFVGTGRRDQSQPGRTAYEWTVPEGVFQRASHLTSNTGENLRILAKVVASRRRGASGLQFAKLVQSGVLDYDEGYVFEAIQIPCNRDNEGLNLLKLNADEFDGPALELRWDEPGAPLGGQMTVDPQVSKVQGLFKWNTHDDAEDMSSQWTIACLEHYVEWSPR